MSTLLETVDQSAVRFRRSTLTCLFYAHQPNEFIVINYIIHSIKYLTVIFKF